MPKHLPIAGAAGPTVPSLTQLWAGGITHPTQAMQTLPGAGDHRLGLRAVLTRFLVTDLIETLPQALLGRRPFTPPGCPSHPSATIASNSSTSLPSEWPSGS